MLVCPICKEKLELEGRTYRCKNNHCFDKAKQGYVNLHIHKKSKVPGDDKAMVVSRREFLEKDYYKEISNKVNDEVYSLLKDKKEITILDIGCGEGYYTSHLQNHLTIEGLNPSIYGVDISKEAVLLASKTYKKIDWLVASGADVPLADKSVDLIICLFSRIIPKEYSRLLKDDGHLLIVSSGEDHLIDIKEVVYDKVKKDFYRPEKDLMEYFSSKKVVEVKYREEIRTKEDIKNLFDMTPYRWTSPKEGVDRLFKLDSLEVTVNANIDVFSKKV